MSPMMESKQHCWIYKLVDGRWLVRVTRSRDRHGPLVGSKTYPSWRDAQAVVRRATNPEPVEAQLDRAALDIHRRYGSLAAFFADVERDLFMSRNRAGPGSPTAHLPASHTAAKEPSDGLPGNERRRVVRARAPLEPELL